MVNIYILNLGHIVKLSPTDEYSQLVPRPGSRAETAGDYSSVPMAGLPLLGRAAPTYTVRL